MTAPSGPAPLDTRAIRETLRGDGYFATTERTLAALCDEVDRLRAENAKLEAERAAWQDYAEHVVHCVECGEMSPDSCFVGGTLRTTATECESARVASTPEEGSRG